MAATLTDASKPPLGQGDAKTLPVYKYEAPETVATGGVLREGGAAPKRSACRSNMDVTQGELDARTRSVAGGDDDRRAGLSPKLSVSVQSSRRSASFLPNIMTYRALASLNLDDAALKAQLDSNVNYALQRLYAQQNVDGGWGWFVQDDSDPLTTAYALIGLSEAQSAGLQRRATR